MKKVQDFLQPSKDPPRFFSDFLKIPKILVKLLVNSGQKNNAVLEYGQIVKVQKESLALNSDGFSQQKKNPGFESGLIQQILDNF